jgi:uridine phosphorylase
MAESPDPQSPLFEGKDYAVPSVFRLDALLSEARRQKDLPDRSIPDICVLDPDADLVSHLVDRGEVENEPAWPGYHTDLHTFRRDGESGGIVGCAVGAPFAVLVAEQLFAAGCEFLVSVTSAGQITPKDDPPYFVLVDDERRD